MGVVFDVRSRDCRRFAMVFLRVMKLVVLFGSVFLFAGCQVSPVDLSASVSSGDVDTADLRGRTVYLKVSDTRSNKSLGVVEDAKGEELVLESSKPAEDVVRSVFESTLRGYGMTVVDSISSSDNQMFVSLKDLEYEYPARAYANTSESNAVLRISLAGDRTAHENIIQTWSRYEAKDLSAGGVKTALNDVLSRAVQNALTEKKMITVLAGK